MIMRVSWGRIKPGTWDDFERLWKEAAAKLRGSEGLSGHWLMRDIAQPDSGYSTSLWRDVEAMDAATEMREIVPEIMECFTGQYTINVCDVRAAEPASLLPR